jgi:anti-anti-sigma factor
LTLAGGPDIIAPVPDLTIQVQDVKGVPGASLVILNGSIDAKTVITFQTQLNAVKERGSNRFILDMENVKYVNSTGLGYLINLSDSVNPERGSISLVKVQPKVKVVFDMLGLNAFFKIYPSRDEAMRHFQAEPSASPSDQTLVLKVGKGDVPPAPVVATATAVAEPVARPARTTSPAPAPVPPPPAAPPAHPRSGEETITVDCAACRALLSVQDVGTYKCPRCLTLFHYDGGGKASFLPRRNVLPVQLGLNFSDDATQGLVQFVRVMAARAGFSEAVVGNIEAVVRDTVQTIRRYAYGSQDNNVYHVMVARAGAEIEIRFADSGSTLTADRTGEDGKPLFGPARSHMDRFEIRNHPRGGNVITVSKKAK